MQGEEAVRDEGRLARGLPGIASMNGLFGYLYCMLLSTAIIQRPVLGGAMYMVGQVTLLFSRLLKPGVFRKMPRGLRRTGIILGAVSALLSLGMLLVYPLAVELPRLWLVFAMACLVLLMNELAARLERGARHRGLNRVRILVRQAELLLLFCGAAALILFFSLPAPTAWYLLGGYALCCLFRLVTLPGEEQRENGLGETVGEPALEAGRLAGVSVYKAFRTIMMMTVTALQVTMILIYTFIGTSPAGLLAVLALAFACIVLSRWATALMLRRTFSRHRMEPATALLIGLVLWVMSLLAFALHSFNRGLIWNYAALALCTAGVTMAAGSLMALEKDMRDVVHFALGSEPGPALMAEHTALSEFAALIGGMIALIGLMLGTLFSGGSISPSGVNLITQPLLLLPALALAAAAIPAAFHFPLDTRIRAKILTFLRLKEKGENNQSLQRQLEDLVIKVHRRRYGIKLVILILRPFFYSKVVGAEKVKLDPDISCVFTCNHGELWGPAVSNLFLPFSFRPWVLDEISEPEKSADYLYVNTVSRQKWLPEMFKRPVAKMTAAFLAWVCRSIDGISVYRDKPLALVKTFKLTAEAMQAGDNILIFPENPNDDSLEKPGYLQDGIGEFFTGFALAAQMYYQRTGKRAQFYPIYADKKSHTLNIGEPVRYDPVPHHAVEHRRIAAYLRMEMLRMAGLADAGDKEQAP